jgi:hypothetical protein
MYEVDALDKVIRLESAPRPDIGAPLPVVLANDWDLILLYVISERDPNWDGTYVNVVSSRTENLKIARVKFLSPHAHMFGPPNDEAFSGHPLAERGLEPYSVSEVFGSSWIRKLDRMNSVHPEHNPANFEKLRHFVFAFHDTTFECVAKSFEVDTFRDSIISAIELATKLLR